LGCRAPRRGIACWRLREESTVLGEGERRLAAARVDHGEGRVVAATWSRIRAAACWGSGRRPWWCGKMGAVGEGWGLKRRAPGISVGETGRDPGVIRGRGCCCAGVAGKDGPGVWVRPVSGVRPTAIARAGSGALVCGPELAAGPSERRTRNAEAGARGRRGLIGSRLGRAWPVPASQAPTAQAQRMQRHPDWITALN